MNNEPDIGVEQSCALLAIRPLHMIRCVREVFREILLFTQEIFAAALSVHTHNICISLIVVNTHALLGLCSMCILVL